MDRMLYVAMSGAKQLMQAQAVNAHNLANINTTGFRADFLGFSSVPVEGPVFPSRVYGQVETRGVDLDAGPIMTTARELDVAVKGNGYIAVQAPDGGEAYTRAGDLRLGSGGQLVTGAGHPVIGSGGPIAVPPYEKLEIGVDGTISIRPVGQGASALAVVDRIKLVRPEPKTLVKGEDGLLRHRDGAPISADARAQVISGALEGSNVSGVGTMINMIQYSREFELNVKIMRAAEENEQRADNLLSIA